MENKDWNFDMVTDRTTTNSMKWDVADGELPMWVADMDFPTAPAVREAIQKRVENGAFGYSIIPDSWYSAVADWWRRRHNFDLKEEWLIFATGIVPAISSMVRRLARPGDNVLVISPVYNIFFNSIVNNGCRAVQCPLRQDGDSFSIDFDMLSEKLSDPRTNLMIFCNPHNPTGTIWDRDTLAKIGDICAKYHVTVISDEVHCELTDPGTHYLPFAAASDTCRELSVTCISPSKAFNLAGLHSCAVFAANRALYDQVNRGLNNDELAEPGSFAIESTEAAYRYGEAWLDDLRQYLYENKQLIWKTVAEELPDLRAIVSPATYLVWIDCRKIYMPGPDDAVNPPRLPEDRLDPDHSLAGFIRRDTGLFLCDGSEYGLGGEGFLRLNAACPRSMVEDGLQRLKKGVQDWKKSHGLV